MKESSKDFNKPVDKPVGLGSGNGFQLIIFELAKQHRKLAGDKEAMGWTIKGAPAARGVTQGLTTVISGDEDLVTVPSGTILVCPMHQRY
jgi:hypothetical protein